jgi:hypothetical protein
MDSKAGDSSRGEVERGGWQYLEEDVGRVEVAMADAFGVHILHASRNAEENGKHGSPAMHKAVRLEHLLVHCVAQRAAAAKFLRKAEQTVRLS